MGNKILLVCALAVLFFESNHLDAANSSDFVRYFTESKEYIALFKRGTNVANGEATLSVFSKVHGTVTVKTLGVANIESLVWASDGKVLVALVIPKNRSKDPSYRFWDTSLNELGQKRIECNKQSTTSQFLCEQPISNYSHGWVNKFFSSFRAERSDNDIEVCLIEDCVSSSLKLSN